MLSITVSTNENDILFIAKTESAFLSIEFDNSMLEKIIGAIKNEQSRETGNIGYTRHKPKTNKTKP